MADLTLMRHSISRANEDGLCDSGRLDAPLSRSGQYLARSEASFLRTCPDALYTSDMNRASETARIFAEILERKFGRPVPVIVIPALRGQDYGDLEGLPVKSPAYKMLYAASADLDIESFGGESDDDACVRQLNAFLDVTADMKKNGYDSVRVVTHSDTISRCYYVLQGEPPKMPRNCQTLGPFETAAVVTRISAFLRPVPFPFTRGPKQP